MSSSISPFTPELALLPGLLEARQQIDKMIQEIMQQNGIQPRPAGGSHPSPVTSRAGGRDLFQSEIHPGSSSEISGDRLSPSGRARIIEAQRRRWAKARGDVPAHPKDDE